MRARGGGGRMIEAAGKVAARVAMGARRGDLKGRARSRSVRATMGQRLQGQARDSPNEICGGNSPCQ